MAAILVISIFLYLKRILNTNRIYGKAVWIEAIVFTLSNTAAGCFNYFLSKNNSTERIIEERDSRAPLFATIIIPYFVLTEFLPAICFAFTVDKLARVLSGELNE